MTGIAKHKFDEWTQAKARKATKESDHSWNVKRFMQHINLLPKSNDPHNWKKAAPRWALISALLVCGILIAVLWNKLETANIQQLQRLEQSVNDGPTKYQARLSERVAVLEAQSAELSKQVTQLTAEVKASNLTMIELTYQLKLNTAEMKASRR